MATSTFDKKIEIHSVDSLKKLINIMASDAPSKPLSLHPYSDKDRDRSERLLKQCLFRSKK